MGFFASRQTEPRGHHPGQRRTQTVSFKRRKGTRYTLFDASGGALPEDMLDPYLGSLTRETFSRAFGLSAKGLRKGAKEMLESGGEVGASLFAAASGLRGLNEMRTRLDTETSAIFTPHRSQNRTFYQALKRFEDAAKEIKQREFRDRDLKERLARVESLAQALESIRERRRLDALRREQLERLREVAPLLHTITRHERTLAEWPELPVLGERDLTRLRDAWDRAEEAEASLDRLVSGHEQDRLYVESFAFEQALLMEAAAVQSLQGQTGAYVEKKGQIGGVRAEGDKTRRELEDMRIRLGLPVEADVSSMQPSDASVVRTRKLLARGRALEQALLAHAQGIRTEAEEVERLGAERRSAGAVSISWISRYATLPSIFYFSSYDLFGALFKQMDNPKPATAGRFKGVRYFNGGLFSTVELIELTRYELELIGDDDSGAALKNWSKVNPDQSVAAPRHIERFRQSGPVDRAA